MNEEWINKFPELLIFFLECWCLWMINYVIETYSLMELENLNNVKFITKLFKIKGMWK